MKTIWLCFFALGLCITMSGCQAASGVSTLLDDGDPDLIALPQAGFCRDGNVVVTLRNQGPSDADGSTTTVTFAGGGSVAIATPGIEGGRIATLPPVTIHSSRAYSAFSLRSFG